MCTRKNSLIYIMCVERKCHGSWSGKTFLANIRHLTYITAHSINKINLCTPIHLADLCSLQAANSSAALLWQPSSPIMMSKSLYRSSNSQSLVLHCSCFAPRNSPVHLPTSRRHLQLAHQILLPGETSDSCCCGWSRGWRSR